MKRLSIKKILVIYCIANLGYPFISYSQKVLPEGLISTEDYLKKIEQEYEERWNKYYEPPKKCNKKFLTQHNTNFKLFIWCKNHKEDSKKKFDTINIDTLKTISLLQTNIQRLKLEDEVRKHKNDLIKVKEKKEQDKLKYQAELKKIANYKKTGAFARWVLKNYVDEFGDRTSQKYIAIFALGVFSNSATEDSRLRSDIIIDDESISIQLYEYARNNPVKNYRSKGSKYQLKIRDNNGVTNSFTLINNSDRLELKKTDYNSFIKILSKVGDIRFLVKEDNSSINKYKFTISTKGFSEAYNALLVLSKPQ